MPFSSVLGASSVIKPGVCTSTTRPSVPYEGQLIYETDTDRVAAYNGSAWVYTHSSGLVLVRSETTFTAASSVTADSVFTSTYRNYKLVVNYITSSSTGVRFRVRAGGSSITTTTYNEQNLDGNSTTAGASRGSSATSVLVGTTSIGAYNSSMEIMIYNPQIATPTTLISTCVYSSGAYTNPCVALNGGNNSNATAYDGFELFTSSGTITGNYTLYGLANS